MELLWLALLEGRVSKGRSDVKVGPVHQVQFCRSAYHVGGLEPIARTRPRHHTRIGAAGLYICNMRGA